MGSVPLFLDLEIEGWTYQYDYENRLIKVIKKESNEDKTITFKYDPFGRRIEKKVESIDKGISETSIYTYTYDNEDIILETQTTSSGQQTTKYVHGPGIDEPLSMTNATDTYYYHADGLGSITAMTDSTGKIVQAYEYDSFGNLHDNMNAIKQPYTYTGREWDKETGFYYYRARYYDPMAGRFISKDPIGFNGGDINLYAAVRNNPINNTDPSGMAVYRCTRPLNGFPNSSLLLSYLGLGHRYLWVDSMTPYNGWGLAPAAGYATLSLTSLTVPGRIQPEPARIGNCQLITTDSCKEQKVKELIEAQIPLLQQYNLISYNCYDWARTVEWFSGL